MTSDPVGAFVWTWLPNATEPVVAGRLEREDDSYLFAYGRSYLDRPDAIALYLPELPLRPGPIAPPTGLRMPGCIDDAGPDAWGQRVVMNRVLARTGRDADPAVLDSLTYLLESGSDRIGALDFQDRADAYVPRSGTGATLEELLTAAERVENGALLTSALDLALVHGSSVGGARPKALLVDDGRTLVAKFSSTTDTYPVVKGEFLAMELARRAGLDVAGVELRSALGKDVLLVERFDRAHAQDGTWTRRHLVSALTILALDELVARYATYTDLATVVRERFTDPTRTLRELFARISWNVLVGNTDDHARNHAALWDGRALTLTPAYDICPQPRAGGEARQAMAYGDATQRELGEKMSQVARLVDHGPTYRLTAAQARDIVDHQIDVIRTQWAEVCDLAELAEVDRAFFWRRQFLNDYALEGW